MSVTEQLRDAVQRNDAWAEARIEKYFSAMNEAVERATKVIGKLPAGEKIAPRYSDLATKVVDLQRESTLKVLRAQVKTRRWPRTVGQAKNSPAGGV
jgi:uncharacterized protein (DUF1697 family)